MKKSLKLLGCLWLVCLGAMLPCAGDEAFAGDNNQPLTCTAYTGADDTDTPRRRMLLGSGTGTRKTHTYYGSSSSNSGNSNTTMIFVGDPQDIIVDSAKVVMRLHWSRIDEPDFVPPSTTPAVSFNGVSIGHMTKLNSKTQNDEFIINPSLIKFNDYNTLWHEGTVNNPGSGSWASVTIEGVVKRINLQASSNLDDSIKLSWDTSSGMSGVRYYIDRRGSEKEVFQCLNKDNPTRERHYYDRTCLPGVKYYYRVRSESGIESNEVVGNRVAKTVEPKFQFTLTGTDRPSTRGINNEADVLVAGRVFNLTVSPIDATQNVSLKKIELIGTPTGGAPRQNAHRIIWVSNGTEVPLSAQGLLWVKGRPFPAQSCLTLNATLRAGPGCHGEYQWSVDCEYEQDGKKGTCKAISQSTGMNIFGKNVYFYKYGFDNGVPTEKYWEYDRKKEEWIKVPSKGKIMPNWYTYWKEDGACPGLKRNDISYRGKEGQGGESFINYARMGFEKWRYAYIDTEAAELWYYPESILSKLENVLGGSKLPPYLYGIYKVEDVVAHELRHNTTAEVYHEKMANGGSDWDKDGGKDAGKKYCMIQTGEKTGERKPCETDSTVRSLNICDNIVDEDEQNGFWVSAVTVPQHKVKIQANFLDYKDPDTYNLEVNKAWVYGAYGDNEFVSLVAGRLGVSNANPTRDWAYPGELSGGFPNELLMSPSYHNTRMLSATPKSSPKLQSSELQSNTNLIISINSIAVDTQRDQNSVTGIVYTIGVAIQGDELVDFNGYLVDAQSNVVATAFSAANAESESVELVFDSRNIFDNYNGGTLTLGRVDLTVDGNYSTNNVIGTLHDFAVEPIEVNKSELLCNKGYILDGATTNDVSASGIAVSIPVLVNVADDYRLEAELVSTNDELVATAFATNYCETGTNVFALTFSSDAIYQNGRSGIHAVKNVQLWCGDEMIDANATALELTEDRDIADFVPSGVSVAVDSSSGRFLEPDATSDGKLSSLRFVFDVTNATDTMVGYDVASVLMNTNSEIVASIRTAVAMTNGLTQIEITIPASTIAKSGVNGPYRLESIELLPQDEDSCGTTYRPSALSAAYMASDFGVSAIGPCGTPRLVETLDSESLMIEYSYEALRVGRVVAEVVLADRNGDFAARVITTNDVSEIGVKTNSISIASDDVTGGITNSPYAVACLSLTPDIIGESSVYMDTESLTNIFWQVAAPVFSPVTKTVFFRQDQPVVISCAADGAEMRYTLDGSEPTDASPLYEGAFTISSNTTVKAKAFAANMRPSETACAEYIRAAIVGDNLVQYTSPGHGVSQTVSVPVPGTYQISFNWTQGGDIELRLSKDGEIRTVAAISADTAGTTNLLFEISAAGDYELTTRDLSSGAPHPAEVSGLSMSIPDTPENRRRLWIYETENTYCSTGEWVGGNGFKNGKMQLDGSSTFVPYAVSDGRFVTVVVEAELGSFDDREPLEQVDAKGAMSVGETDGGTLAFMVLTRENGAKTWKAVTARGLAAPTLGASYTVKFVLDCTNKTYTAFVIGDEEMQLGDGTTNEFAFAGHESTALEMIGFVGTGSVMSLFGSCRNLEAGFAYGDVLTVAGGSVTLPLTASQAAWLNSMNAYDSVRARISAMGADDIMLAYLLNLDLTRDGCGLVSFSVSGIEVTETEVRIQVRLSRVGAMQVQGTSGMQDAPINGILKLYGGNTPGAKTMLNATMVTGENFGEGDSATFVYPRSGNARFFRPVIEVP